MKQAEGFRGQADKPSPRILIMCEFEKGALGGGESVLFGLVEGLVARAGDQFRIIALTSRSMQKALQDLLPPPHEVVARPEVRPSFPTLLKRRMRIAFPRLTHHVRRVLRRPVQGLAKKVAQLDDFSRSLSPDLIHWIYPLHYAISEIPDICTVHDLNYEHLRDDFTEDYVTWRRTLMAEQVARSKALVTISGFVSEDLLGRHPEAVGKICAVQWAPFICEDSGAKPPRAAHTLVDGTFVLYPAATYKHKNHGRLIEALCLVNARRTTPLKLVLTGPLTPEWQEIGQRYAAEFAEGTVVHLGFLTKNDLTGLFDNCALVAFPSLFEGAGLPLIEAIAMEKTICCSDIKVFREYGGDYPLYFDPECVQSIAEAIEAALKLGPTRPRLAQLRKWSDVADNYLQIYSDVLASAGGAELQR